MVRAVSLVFMESAEFQYVCGQVNYVLPYGVLVVLGHIIFATFEFSRWRNFQKKGEVSMSSLLSHQSATVLAICACLLPMLACAATGACIVLWMS